MNQNQANKDRIKTAQKKSEIKNYHEFKELEKQKHNIQHEALNKIGVIMNKGIDAKSQSVQDKCLKQAHEIRFEAGNEIILISMKINDIERRCNIAKRKDNRVSRFNAF
jgi:hypothetical protein